MAVGSVKGWKPLNSGGTGELLVTTSAEQVPANASKLVKIKAKKGNTGKIYVGFSSGVIATAGADNTSVGYELSSSEDTGWLPISNTNKLYVIASATGQGVFYMWLN